MKLVSATLLLAACAFGQSADTILVGGKIVTVDAQSSVREALAVRDGKILATGTTAEIRKLAGAQTRVINLAGRTVIPGLIDSHMHAIRAALSFSTEVNWIGAKSLTEALGRILLAASARQPGTWLIVAGGWDVNQFAEKRRPTQVELEAAAGDHPAYVQLGYGWALLNSRGLKTLGIASEKDLPAGGRLENGAVSGAQAAIITLFDRLPKPTFAEQIDGTRKFFTELNRLGMTGVVDPGGNNLTPDQYEALFNVWRAGQLTMRVAYSLCNQGTGTEFEEFQNMTRLLPMGFGDEMLHFNGIGERITAAMYNNDRPSATDKEKFAQILKWAAGRGMAITLHWGNDASVGQLLDIFESVNKEVPIANLRWSIAHLNDASVKSLVRMKALGVGWTVQDAMYFGGDAYLQRAGAAAARRVPPVETAKKIGVVVGAGTDAHRVASYNPFTSLQWFLDGKTVNGNAIRVPEETPDRMDALRFYTLGSAWFSKDEAKRGSLEAGKLADLAVLSKDYMTVPVEQVGGIESVLTMVGGKVVYSTAPYATLR